MVGGRGSPIAPSSVRPRTLGNGAADLDGLGSQSRRPLHVGKSRLLLPLVEEADETISLGVAAGIHNNFACPDRLVSGREEFVQFQVVHVCTEKNLSALYWYSSIYGKFILEYFDGYLATGRQPRQKSLALRARAWYCCG